MLNIDFAKSDLYQIDVSILQCPICGGNISESFTCSECKMSFPSLYGKPILINESNSLLSFSDYTGESQFTFFDESNTTSKKKSLSLKSRIKARISKAMPKISMNLKAAENYTKFAKLLLANKEKPSILILGAGELGRGLEKIIDNKRLEFIKTDVSFSDGISLICDAHDIPFKDGTIDGVIIQAVLEHVVDPHRCVQEIRRILKENGIVYAETPFMQQVHGGAYDFTRFTFLGHRRLFRHFKEIDMGMVAGPGTALAWSYQYFLRSFMRGKTSIKMVNAFTRLTAFFWKYFDIILQHNPNSLDAASGYYFMGKKEDNYTLSDRDLIKIYDSVSRKKQKH